MSAAALTQWCLLLSISGNQMLQNTEQEQKNINIADTLLENSLLEPNLSPMSKLFWRNFMELACLQVGERELLNKSFVADTGISRMAKPRRHTFHAFLKSEETKCTLYTLCYTFIIKEHP